MDREDGIVPKGGYPSRLKYVVVAGTSRSQEELCVVLINSKAAYGAAACYAEMQYKLRKEDYEDFLTHDSYVDCAKPKAIKTSKVIVKRTQRIGRMSNKDLESIMSILSSNKLLKSSFRSEFNL